MFCFWAWVSPPSELHSLKWNKLEININPYFIFIYISYYFLLKISIPAFYEFDLDCWLQLLQPNGVMCKLSSGCNSKLFICARASEADHAMCYWNKTGIFMQEFDSSLNEIKKMPKVKASLIFLSFWSSADLLYKSRLTFTEIKIFKSLFGTSISPINVFICIYVYQKITQLLSVLLCEEYLRPLVYPEIDVFLL